MPKLTSEQAFALAQQFNVLSARIGDFRFSHWDDLSPSQSKKLEDLQFDVLNDSTKFNQISISLSLNELEATLTRIGQATTRMKNAIRTLNNINKVIKIGTAAVTLGAAIVSMNPGAIINAVDGAVSAVNAP